MIRRSGVKRCIRKSALLRRSARKTACHRTVHARTRSSETHGQTWSQWFRNPYALFGRGLPRPSKALTRGPCSSDFPVKTSTFEMGSAEVGLSSPRPRREAGQRSERRPAAGSPLPKVAPGEVACHRERRGGWLFAEGAGKWPPRRPAVETCHAKAAPRGGMGTKGHAGEAGSYRTRAGKNPRRQLVTEGSAVSGLATEGPPSSWLRPPNAAPLKVASTKCAPRRWRPTHRSSRR